MSNGWIAEYMADLKIREEAARASTKACTAPAGTCESGHYEGSNGSYFHRRSWPYGHRDYGWATVCCSVDKPCNLHKA